MNPTTTEVPDNPFADGALADTPANAPTENLDTTSAEDQLAGELDRDDFDDEDDDIL